MDEDHRNARVGLVGALIIATISGLIIRIVGEPLADATEPGLKDFFESIEEFVQDPQDAWEDWWD